MIAMIKRGTITNSIRLNPREFFARLLHTDALINSGACENRRPDLRGMLPHRQLGQSALGDL